MGTCIFPRDKTGLTMGKPEVNLTFFEPGPFFFGVVFKAFYFFITPFTIVIAVRKAPAPAPPPAPAEAKKILFPYFKRKKIF
jgi:hypothetical protein